MWSNIFFVNNAVYASVNLDVMLYADDATSFITDPTTRPILLPKQAMRQIEKCLKANCLAISTQTASVFRYCYSARVGVILGGSLVVPASKITEVPHS